jgi:hypothetical protein
MPRNRWRNNTSAATLGWLEDALKYKQRSVTEEGGKRSGIPSFRQAAPETQGGASMSALTLERKCLNYGEAKGCLVLCDGVTGTLRKQK